MITKQCEAIKDNKMQCGNEAFVTVDGVNYCRLHLNWMVGLKHIDLDKAVIAVINPEDQKEVDKIIETGREQLKAESEENAKKIKEV